MKKPILLFIFAFLLCTFSFAQEYGWMDISSNVPGDSLWHDLSDVFFISDNEGWISSSSHPEIYHTTDGGETFETQQTQFPCNAIQMINENTGYAGGGNGRVYRTIDGGENWNAIGSIGVTLTGLSFPLDTNLSDPVGYGCGFSGGVWEITSTLTNLNTGLSGDFNGISAPSVNNVWVCGGNRIYYYNGTNFTSQIAPTGTFNDIHFINNQEGWVVGDGGVIGHTEDGGAYWTTQTNPDIQNRSLYGVFFLDSNNGWAVSNGGVILHTIDGGTTWTIEGEGLTTAFLRGVQFTSPTNGYVVGNNKTLFKYTEVTGIEDFKETIEFEIFPNPAASFVSLQSAAFSQQSALVEIYDLNGRKLIEKQFRARSESVEIDVSSLQGGIYCCKLSTEKGSVTKKLIIQK